MSVSFCLPHPVAVSAFMICVDISSPMPLIFSVATLHTFGPNMVSHIL